ncbi:sensor histidine kinase [Marinomonas sp. ef1]|uniref:sensor histidine kinase n=1 Tax=Marinomonas sp. ef1 TaxID=2005043 RepID=UPI000C281D31|nr:sensor histidine kinase [Marinomonas sp. ef1]
MILRNYSIRQRVLLVTSSILLVMCLLAYWSANLYGHRAARISYDNQLLGAALQMAESITLVDGELIVDLPLSAFEILAMSPRDRGFYAVRDVNNTLITGYDDLPLPSKTPKTTPLYYNDFYSGESVRFVQLKKRLLDTDIDTSIVITLGQTSIAREALAKEMSLFVTQFVLLFFCVFMLLITIGIWLVLRPLKSLGIALESRSSTDLSPIKMIVPKEIQPLLGSINYFMEKLNTTLKRLKRFTGEAAHQLRTPLAGLRSEAQSALEEHDSHSRNEQLKNVIACCDELTVIISMLLNQANLAHRFQSDDKVAISLPKLVTDICREVTVVALESDVEIAYVSEEKEAMITGNEYALKQMVRNLLENAVKYSPKDSPVEVSIDTSVDSIILQIRDHGYGIPDSEKERVFEYLYRSKNNIKSGTGIGLAIASEVAEHHYAILELKDNQPTGLIVEVRFQQEKQYES